MMTHVLITSTVEEISFLHKYLDCVYDVIDLTLLVVKGFCWIEIVKKPNYVSGFTLDQASKGGSVCEYL